MLYVTSSNGKCMCAALRPLPVTKEQANKCEYPVSRLVRFRCSYCFDPGTVVAGPYDHQQIMYTTLKCILTSIEY